MNKKPLDWTFYIKIVMATIGGLFLLSFLRTKWALYVDEEEQVSQKTKSPTTNPLKPLRVQIMSLNTISLFFMLMSVSEFRTNEFMSPFGVDPNNIPPACKFQQESYTWMILFFCLAIVGYNYFIVGNGVLGRATRSNVVSEKKQSEDRYRYTEMSVEKINKYIKALNIKNAKFMVERYPSKFELMFFAIVSILSIVFYILLVLQNYGVINTNMFRPCVDPDDTSRFYNPYNNAE